MMLCDEGPAMKHELEVPGCITEGEIIQQPALWPDTMERVRRHRWKNGPVPEGVRVVICGAGTSAYAAQAIESAWPFSTAIPTTDLLPDPAYVGDAAVMLSLARSGNSPESVGVVESVLHGFPKIAHIAITCNADGRLAHHPAVDALLLDPRTNDRSLVMTSSFSNLVLAGIAMRHAREIEPHLDTICGRATATYREVHSKAARLAEKRPSRVVVLASRPLFGWALEARLKLMEMTAGRIAVMAETYLGLRHGPMSFVDSETLVLCLLSTDAHRRRYEDDLLAELRAKHLGRLVVIQPDAGEDGRFYESIGALAPELPDPLRTPFEIVFPQLLAWHLSVNFGLNPDSPSPNGVITRVVEGVPIYER
jgi:tagatose-6-phosphate ketose/aldose isomerase